MSDTQSAPSMSAPIWSSVAASLMMASALLFLTASPAFGGKLAMCLIAPISVLCALWQWVIYFRQYVGYRVEQMQTAHKADEV
jgi:hypothetical protein